MFKDDDYYSVEEAAKFLELKPQTVRNYLNTGKIKGIRIKTLTVIHKSDLEEFQRLR